MPVLFIQAQGTPPPTPLTQIAREGRRVVPTVMVSGQELIGLDDVAALFQVTVAEDAPTGSVTVTYRGRTIVLSSTQPIASVNGRVVTLPAPVTRSGRRLLVPVEFLTRALVGVYDRRIDLRKTSRLLIVGDVTVPRVVARVDAVGPPTRVTIEVSPAAPVTATVDAGRVIVRVEADALDLALPSAGGGLVDQIRAGDQPNTIVLILGGGAAMPRTATATADGVARVTVEVPSTAPAPVESAIPPAAPPAASEVLSAATRRQFDLVAIDPGHGGNDPGVRTADGVEEKELTLDVARRLRQRLETRLGVRAILTREDDRAMAIDERAAFANNSKADLFLSLHANGALGAGMAGAEVYLLSLDLEGEAVRRRSRTDAVSLPALGGRRVLEVVPWNLAQAAHIETSATFSTMLEEELRRRVPMSPRAVQRAGMRVLTGANMPAALVEMAYLTNADQAGKSRTEDFRNTVADALYEAIARFRTFADEKAAP